MPAELLRGHYSTGVLRGEEVPARAGEGTSPLRPDGVSFCLAAFGGQPRETEAPSFDVRSNCGYASHAIRRVPHEAATLRRYPGYLVILIVLGAGLLVLAVGTLLGRSWGSGRTPTPTVPPAGSETLTSAPSRELSWLQDAVASVVRVETPLGSGSGFVVAVGQVLTAYHVVEAADQVTLVTADGRKHTARLFGANADADLALITAPSLERKALALGSMPNVGTQAVAIGYAVGLEGAPTVTRGIVSAIRSVPGHAFQEVQTDAAINPGNSGGPLLNDAGEVIGVLQTRLQGRTTALEGLAFALSGEDIGRVLPLLQQGVVQRSTTPVPTAAPSSGVGGTGCMQGGSLPTSASDPHYVFTGQGIGVRARSLPKEDSPYSGGIAEFARVTLRDACTGTAGGTWYLVQFGAGREAWVRVENLRRGEPPAAAPQPTATRPPTPPNTALYCRVEQPFQAGADTWVFTWRVRDDSDWYVDELQVNVATYDSGTEIYTVNAFPGSYITRGRELTGSLIVPGSRLGRSWSASATWIWRHGPTGTKIRDFRSCLP